MISNGHCAIKLDCIWVDAMNDGDLDTIAPRLMKAEGLSDLKAITALIDKHAAALSKDPHRKRLIHAIENRFAQLAAPLWDADAVQLHCDIMTAVDHNNSKAAIPLVKHLIAQNKNAEAAILIEALLKLRPTAPGYFNLTIPLKDTALQSSLQAAHFKRLTVIAKHDAAARILLARQLMQCGQFELAHDVLKGDTTPDARAMLATIYFWLNRFEDAENAAAQALASPDTLPDKHHAALYLHLIKCQITLRKPADALQTLSKYKAKFPSAPYDAVDHHAHILNGEFEQAYAGYSETRDVKVLQDYCEDHEKPEGLDVKNIAPDKTCFVLSCMGLGDEIRFSRMISMIASKFKALTIVCDPRLSEIYKASFPAVKFHGLDRSAPAPSSPPLLAQHIDETSAGLMPQHDYAADLKQFTSLYAPDVKAAAERTDLIIPSTLRTKWQSWVENIGGPPAIGLFWRSNLPSHSASVKQSRLEDWLDLLNPLKVNIVPLQYDMTAEETAIIESHPNLFIRPPDLDTKDDIAETFALLCALPLVMTLPGTVQHMAGAVGTQTLCPAHPYEANWRRHPNHTHDIWSPSVEIISDKPELGLMGSMRLAVKHLEQWLENQP